MGPRDRAVPHHPLWRVAGDLGHPPTMRSGRAGHRPVSSPGDELGGLDHVERRALAQVVPADEQVQRGRRLRSLPDAAREARVGADDVVGRGELGLVGVVEHDDGGRLDQGLAGLGDAHPAGERRVHRDRVRRHDGHPDARGRDGQVRDVEDLAGLLAHLDLLGGPAVAHVVADEGNDVEHERRREDRLPQLVFDEPPHVTGPHAQLTVAVHDVELVVEAPDARRGPARTRPGTS